MQGAVRAHRNLASRVGGVAAVLILLLWPASAYGSPGSTRHRQATAGFSACTGNRADTGASSLDLRLAPPRPAFVCGTTTLLDVFLTGAWASAHQYVGSPGERHYSQEQMAASIVRTLHPSS